jgi:hypothetical protein
VESKEHVRVWLELMGCKPKGNREWLHRPHEARLPHRTQAMRNRSDDLPKPSLATILAPRSSESRVNILGNPSRFCSATTHVSTSAQALNSSRNGIRIKSKTKSITGGTAGCISGRIVPVLEPTTSVMPFFRLNVNARFTRPWSLLKAL